MQDKPTDIKSKRVSPQDKLTDYKNKRDFTKTAEPSGAEESQKEKRGKTEAREWAAKKLRFAVQHHKARRDHYDLRLEWDGVLLSWAVPKGPSYNPRDKRLAVKVEDHPVAYADFEGVIPKGEYGGGTVLLWDEGTYVPNVDFQKGLTTGSLKFELHGKRLRGNWALVRLKGNQDADNWLLIKETDAFARETDGIAAFTTGIRSHKTHERLARADQARRTQNPPDFLNGTTVQLCKQVTDVPKGDDWLFEVKYDGYRTVAVVQAGEVKLYSRNGHDYTQKFAPVARALAVLGKDRAFVLDGETVVPDEEGKTDFGALQAYEKNPQGELVYMAFDLLALDGEDLRALPLIERKKKLGVLLAAAPSCVRESAYVTGRGEESARAAQAAGLEGVVGKRVQAPYRGGRGGDWIKYKCYRRQEFVLGGYTRTDKSEIGALLLGVYKNAENNRARNESGKLQYAGRAGTGLRGKSEKDLLRLFSEYASETPPFTTPPHASGGEKIFWLTPELVGEVQFAEWTNENRLRQASFKGLRADKAPEEVVREDAPRKTAATTYKKTKSSDGGTQKTNPNGKDAVGKRVSVGEKTDFEKQKSDDKVICNVKITHPQRVVYPDVGITKEEVAAYYAAVAERMLPYVKNRILSVVRCHNGVGGGCFFNKHPSPASRARSVTVAGGENKHTYFYIETVEQLITEVQLGALEFHVWGSRVQELEKPDMMVFDLDPDTDMPLARVRDGVRAVKEVIDSLKLPSFLKTSGGKGYHITVPFTAPTDWERFRAFARNVARVLEKQYPDAYTSNMRKENRKGRIFIDWGRNTRGATSVAPYSLRARDGAKVSMPIGWEELDRVAPDAIDLFAAERRLKKPDAWSDFFK